MKNPHPALHPRLLGALMQAAIERCRLDLSGSVILTEAASGAYIVTPILAAMAGAKQVYALTRSTRYGTIEEIVARTLKLAAFMGVDGHIQPVTQKLREIISQADIITNSGHVRPIDTEIVKWMKPTAVIPLMYEGWEFRRADVDIDACHQAGIPVAATNERHPPVDVFSFLGLMALKLLLDAGVVVDRRRILLLCDNPFRPFIERSLTALGATVVATDTLSAALDHGAYHAILVALQPRSEPVLSTAEASEIVSRWPEAIVVQFWGDLDRSALATAEVPFWPIEAPLPGHMGILPSEIGPEPIVRLQSGGLKVGELLWRARLTSQSVEDAIVAVERSGFGERIVAGQ